MRNRNLSSPSDKKVWNFSTLHDLHIAANALLRQAMLNERSKRWTKVIANYTELLWMIDLANLPEDYEPPSVYSMLLYELYYHLGVAYQQKGDHQKAIAEFSNAIEAVSIAKNGCLAGCLTNSCLMTPLYARKAFAQSRLGSYKLALKDAETAVVLDSKSPEVYCIRALVKSTFDDELIGLKDLDIALKINPSHLCATMLKASFTKPLSESPKEITEKEEDSDEAARLFQESNSSYINCNSFTHPCIMEFYDKFLFPLSVPHTVTVINLKPEKPSKKQLESNADIYKGDGLNAPTTIKSDVFRCGTPKISEGYKDRISLQRRKDYGNAIRSHMARPKSASEFFSQLEKQRKKEAAAKRAQSAIVRPGSRFATLSPEMTSTRVPTSTGVRPETVPRTKTNNLMDVPDIARVRSAPPGGSTTYNSPVCLQTNRREQDNEKREATPKTIIIDTPTNYSIPVFQPVNVRCAPRMYYRPWIGDKLPAKERPKMMFSPAFY